MRLRMRRRQFLRATPGGVVAPSYTPNAVDFDGTNDYLTRGAALDGVSDSKLVSGGFWINTDADGVTGNVVAGASTVGGPATRGMIVQKQSANLIGVVGYNNSTVVLNVGSTGGSVEAADGWINVLFSMNMADTGQRHLYIADASDLATVLTYTDSTMTFATHALDWAIGASGAGGLKLNGQLSDFWLAPGYYIDFSVEANRRQFITAAGAPAQSPSDALAALSVTAAIILEGDAAGFGTNTGNGGDFTITGSLTDTTPPP